MLEGDVESRGMGDNLCRLWREPCVAWYGAPVPQTAGVDVASVRLPEGLLVDPLLHARWLSSLPTMSH